MKLFKKLLLAALTISMVFIACKKESAVEPEPVKPFDIKEHFVAGTLKSTTGTSISVFFIQFLENNKAMLINTNANNLVGPYTLTDDSLILTVGGGNAFTARFALDKDRKITFADYDPVSGTVVYETTAMLLSATDTNELAGKTFKGDEKGGNPPYGIPRAGVIYNFNADTTAFGSGTDALTINNKAIGYTSIGGRGFKYLSGSNAELGFVYDKKLTVFRSSGLSYYGVYNQQ